MEMAMATANANADADSDVDADAEDSIGLGRRTRPGLSFYRNRFSRMNTQHWNARSAGRRAGSLDARGSGGEDSV